MNDWKRDRIAAAERGENPLVIARMPSGFAVMGDVQFLPGYCLILAVPQVPTLNGLSIAQRNAFLEDMTILGDAVASVCMPRNINYGILGNTEQYLHAHVFPRYDWESPERLAVAPFSYPPEYWTSHEHQYDEAKHGDLRVRLAHRLHALLELR